MAEMMEKRHLYIVVIMQMLDYCINGIKIILLLWVFKPYHVQSSSVTIQSGECKYNPNYFENFTMSIVNNSVNLDMITKKVLNRGFKVHVDFSISLGKAKHYQRVFSHTMDTCGVVSAVKKNIFKAWFQSMLSHGNFMYNCPVVEGRYYLKNWKLDSNLIPQYLMAGDYRVTGHFFFGKLKTKLEEFVLQMTAYAILKTN